MKKAKTDNNVTQADFIKLLSKKTQLSQHDVHEVLRAFTSTVQESVFDGKSVSLAKFGSFQPKKNKERTGRNPSNGEAMKITASTTVKFHPFPASRLKE